MRLPKTTNYGIGVTKGVFKQLKDLSERVTWYDDNQISFSNDVYSVDENQDSVIDYQFSNPDFAFVQFRSNLVARWEYIPGSEIFLVWSQGITGLGERFHWHSSVSFLWGS